MPEPADAVKVQLAKLRKKYGLALPDKVSGIEKSLAPLRSGSLEEEPWNAAYRAVHSLAGSSGTYGYPEISSVARAAEAILKQGLESRAPLSDAQRGQIDDLLARLRELAADAARQNSA